MKPFQVRDLSEAVSLALASSKSWDLLKVGVKLVTGKFQSGLTQSIKDLKYVPESGRPFQNYLIQPIFSFSEARTNQDVLSCL